ncbi:MAG: orotidine-5'-phosphate decarboxylase [Chitinophagaceae bacterium]|nr:MAG: orotidine-5'-phosphate decarboxylase [Chitinophagaceae bacterium]
MHRNKLVEQIQQKGTYLCVGLDTDLTKIPSHLRNRPNAVVEFNKAIIDATKDHCVSYKINTAFYEAMGGKGWEAMEETIAYIPSTHLKIADAKRGDIGNTSSQYARAFFETIPFDAITVAPYMGEDSIRPFLEYENKWTIVLGLTSNKGARDFELLKLVTDNIGNATEEDAAPIRSQYLYEKVLQTVAQWGTPNNLMFVVGATQATEFDNIRSILPDHFFLVPGVGFQGGSLEEISNHAMNKDCGILVNASRAIIYAGADENFATEAQAIAVQYHAEMKNFLNNKR